MGKCHVIDAFPAFVELWPKIQQQAIDGQIEAWATGYMAGWPELLAKQQACYAEDGEDWRRVAREMVFPHLAERLAGMEEAHGHLLTLVEPVHAKAQQILGFDSDMVAVIYAGIGCGAGWVTTYQGMPAILFGLENAAEEGWIGQQVLTGLVAHEIGHVAHRCWRQQRGLKNGSGPWWQLYSEGFAQRCEHVILGGETWHMARRMEGWQDWCQAHEAWLAAEYLRVVDAGKALRPFFGSWFDIRGWKQTGYYLGYRVIRHLEASMDLHQIALLDEVAPAMRLELERLAVLDG
jgi:hypothetical protein